MESSLKDQASSNIPHMHLFMYLKRRFPGLKDADITDSIQRFGLDKFRCEEELQRRSGEQHRGYYSPWSQSRANSTAGSSSNCSSRGSPLSPSDASSPTLHNGGAPSLTSTPAPPTPTPHDAPPLSELRLITGSVQTTDPKAVYSSASCAHVSTTPSSYASFRGAIKEESSSAPVMMPGAPDPFFDAASPVVSRRSSAEPAGGGETPLKVFSSPSPSPSSTPSPATTCTTSFSTHPVGGPQQQQPIHPASIQEQLARKERLEEELSRRLEEKTKLEGEVRNLAEEIQSRENRQRMEVVKSKKEIELIQKENSKLQFICDEMERIILESGESPKTDQGGPVPMELPSPSLQDSPLRVPPQLPLPRASSSSSLGSGGVTTPTTPLIPSRKAPSPPLPPNSIIPPVATFMRNDNQATGRRPTTIGSDEGGKEWSCSECTFRNSPFLNECEMCGFPHFPPLGTPPHLPQHPNPHPEGPCYCHQRHRYNLNHEHRSAVRDI